MKTVYTVETYFALSTVGVYDSINTIKEVFKDMQMYQDGYNQWKMFDVENRDDLEGDDDLLEDSEPDYVINEHTLITAS